MGRPLASLEPSTELAENCQRVCGAAARALCVSWTLVEAFAVEHLLHSPPPPPRLYSSGAQPSEGGMPAQQQQQQQRQDEQHGEQQQQQQDAQQQHQDAQQQLPATLDLSQCDCAQEPALAPSGATERSESVGGDSGVEGVGGCGSATEPSEATVPSDSAAAAVQASLASLQPPGCPIPGAVQRAADTLSDPVPLDPVPFAPSEPPAHVPPPPPHVRTPEDAPQTLSAATRSQPSPALAKAEEILAFLTETEDEG